MFVMHLCEFEKEVTVVFSKRLLKKLRYIFSKIDHFASLL